MQKEELLHLHMLLVHVKKYIESQNGEEMITKDYDSMLISPVHIHKNKVCHKQAILILGEEIVSNINKYNETVVDYTPGASSEEIAVE